MRHLAQVAGGTSQAFAQSDEEGEGTCSERTVGLHCDWLKNIRVGEARILRLFTDWQRGLLRRRQTKQKTTNMKPRKAVVIIVVTVIVFVVTGPPAHKPW